MQHPFCGRRNDALYDTLYRYFTIFHSPLSLKIRNRSNIPATVSAEHRVGWDGISGVPHAPVRALHVKRQNSMLEKCYRPHR